MQARVQAVGQVLFGYYKLPSQVETPIDFSINPIGNAWRSLPRCAALPTTSAGTEVPLSRPLGSQPPTVDVQTPEQHGKPAKESCRESEQAWKPSCRIQCVHAICHTSQHWPWNAHSAIYNMITCCRVWDDNGGSVKLVTLAPKADHSMHMALSQASIDAADMPPTEAAASIYVNNARWGGSQQGSAVVADLSSQGKPCSNGSSQETISSSNSMKQSLLDSEQK